MKPKPEESSLLRECSHILEFLTCASPFNAEARAELIRNSSPAITSWYRWQYSRSYRPARRRKRSELCCRHSRWDESSSVERSSHFSRHSSTTWKHFPAKILNEAEAAQVQKYLFELLIKITKIMLTWSELLFKPNGDIPLGK